MTGDFYYLSPGNETIGPFLWSVLTQLHRAGTITEETLVASDTEPEWVLYSEWRKRQQSCEDEDPCPSSRVATGNPSGLSSSRKRKKPKKAVGKLERIVISVILATIVIAILFAVFLKSPLADHPFLHQLSPWAKNLNPEKTSLVEIAQAIETMPKAYHQNPSTIAEENGSMLLFTGENSAQVRAIPDHAGLYQIDVTRYGVVYDRQPSKPVTRNALTVLLNLGTEFKDRQWHLIEARGGSVDQVTKPGQTSPDEKTTESIPLEEAMWHGQWVIDYLNGENQNSTTEEYNVTTHQSLEESFLKEHQKMQAIRAQGIRIPE